MMRGMFAAISGLKQHQVMLDVTANDIANVNTIGYKSSRVTFQDSLTQLQRGAAAPSGSNGGSNAAPGGLRDRADRLHARRQLHGQLLLLPDHADRHVPALLRAAHHGDLDRARDQ